MADLGTIVSKVTTITTGWFQDVNNAVYRWGTTANTIDTQQHAAPSKATPVDADEVKIADSAASFSFARLTFLNLRNQLFTLFGAQLNASTSKATPVDADSIPIQDSAASNATKQLTWANLKTTLSALTTTWGISTTGNAATATAVTTTINNGVVGTTQATGDSTTKIATDAFVMSRPVLGTVQATTSGTSITFSGIPSWAKRITVNISGLGTSSTSEKYLRVGSGSVASSGYLGTRATVSTASAASPAAITTAWGMYSVVAADRLQGSYIITLMDPTNFIWCVQGIITCSQTSETYYTAGSVTLSGALDRVVLTTANGSDTFAAGSANIMYE